MMKLFPFSGNFASFHRNLSPLSRIYERDLVISSMIVNFPLGDTEFEEVGEAAVSSQLTKSLSNRKKRKKMVETRAQCRRLKTWNGWNGVESAHGVFTEILSRLPVRSIRSFKTINKYWNASASDSKFARKHLSQSRKRPQYIACPSMDSAMELYLLNPGEGDFNYQHHATVNPCGRDVKCYMYMIASFNGLVCCINGISDENDGDDFHEDLQIWICNPSTEETLLLPQGRPSFGIEPCIGVAYGSDTGEYKVFRIFCTGQKKKPGEDVVYYHKSPDAFVHECEVYSSSTGAWRNIGPVPHRPMRVCFSPYKSSHVFAGGKIYWLVSLDGRGKILSVDMEERFEVINLPRYSKKLPEEDRITEATYLITLEGSLSLVILHGEYMDVWVRKPTRWVRRCTRGFPFENENDDSALFVTSSEEEILFVTEETHLWTFDLGTRRWSRRSSPPTEYVNPVMFPFTESLLPCNGGARLEEGED